jgi:Rps23 Pro-64 3,4-dihydroxylase Tpa1-like proline 4-hydroxylase
MQIKDNFLEKVIIEKINLYIDENLKKNVWYSNLSWDEDVRKTSAQVSCLSLLNNQELTYYFKKIYTEIFPDLKNKTLVTLSIYFWHKFSFIPFHKDSNSFLSSTIYLNNFWEKDFGGLFLYEEEDEIKTILPKYNRCIINNNKISHATSMTTLDAPHRKTIQIFFK